MFPFSLHLVFLNTPPTQSPKAVYSRSPYPHLSFIVTGTIYYFRIQIRLQNSNFSSSQNVSQTVCRNTIPLGRDIVNGNRMDSEISLSFLFSFREKNMTNLEIPNIHVVMECSKFTDYHMWMCEPHCDCSSPAWKQWKTYFSIFRKQTNKLETEFRKVTKTYIDTVLVVGQI